jgi:hypothetical protein
MSNKGLHPDLDRKDTITKEEMHDRYFALGHLLFAREEESFKLGRTAYRVYSGAVQIATAILNKGSEELAYPDRLWTIYPVSMHKRGVGDGIPCWGYAWSSRTPSSKLLNELAGYEEDYEEFIAN